MIGEDDEPAETEEDVGIELAETVPVGPDKLVEHSRSDRRIPTGRCSAPPMSKVSSLGGVSSARGRSRR